MTIGIDRRDIEPAAARPMSTGLATDVNMDVSCFQRGHRVLVLENDLILADDLRRELESQGAEVLGPVMTVAEALDILQDEPGPDVAILDVFLEDEFAYPVADALRVHGVPFVFAINRQPWMIPPAYADVPRAEKPVTMRRLAQAFRPRQAEDMT